MTFQAQASIANTIFETLHQTSDSMIKKILLSLFTVFTFVSTFGQAIHSQVDKRVETLSIIARLAGYKEYNDNFAKKYVEDIHRHFDAYKDDTLIGYMKDVNKKDGINDDAVMSMATSLELKGGTFSFIDSWKKDLGRWNQEHAKQFVSLLNVFFEKTNFEDFLKSEATYFASVTNTYDRMMSKLNQSWYYQYYGTKPQGKFNIIIGCGNGGQNYGSTTTSIKYGKQIYAIMGSWSFDEDGNAIFPADIYLPFVVHEFNHSFINPILEKYENNATLKNSAAILFDTMKTKMVADNYGNWQTMVNESLVRASVVRYLKANNASEKDVISEIMNQVNLGFIWIKPLVDLLGDYEKNRNLYPKFDDFYPRIITFFDTTAKHITTLKSKFPKITSIGPFTNHSEDVDPSLKEMTIYFSEKMRDDTYSFYYGELGKNAFPVTKVIGYSDDKKSIKISLNLKPDTEYEMVVTGDKFKSDEYYYPLRNYTIKFKTRKL